MMHPTNDLLVAYIDNELPQETADEVASHVALCARCSGIHADLRATSQYVLGVLHQIDAHEPAEWAAVTAGEARTTTRTNGHGRSEPRERPFPTGGQRALRRAATITLLLTSGAAAAVITANRLLRDGDASTEVSTVQTTAAPATASSGIFIEPRDGTFTIALEGAAAGSRLQVVLDDRSPAQLVVTQSNSPRFVSRAGLLEVHLGGGRADLRLQLPSSMREARVVMGADTIAVVRGRVVTPAQAATGGISLSGSPSR
jgi:anti-sigma factor RsiW